jgi:hypothetical protein
MKYERKYVMIFINSLCKIFSKSTKTVADNRNEHIHTNEDNEENE